MLITDELLNGLPAFPKSITSFAEQFSRNATTFEVRASNTSETFAVFHWNAFADSAGAATMRCGDEPDNDLLLLMSGIDAAADERALWFAANWMKEHHVAPPMILLEQLRESACPLLITFSRLRFAERTLPVEVQCWAFARAFFDILGTRLST